MPRRLLAICLVLVLASVTTRGQVISGCDFETGLCGWQNGGSNQASWRHTQGSTPSQNTGPPSGNGGTGFYIYMEAGDFDTGGSTTVPGGHVTLTSPTFTLAGPACFRLFSYMWVAIAIDNVVGNLTVGTLRTGGNTTLLSRVGRQSESWNCSYLTIPQGSSPFQIFVEASVGSHSDLGDIAVDDFALFNTSCEAIASQQICVTNAGVSTTQRPDETSSTSPSVFVPTSNTSQGSSSVSSSITAATTSNPLGVAASTMAPEEEVGTSSLLFLLIPAGVIVLAIPVAIYCYLKRRKKESGPVFRPYIPPDEPEVYDELGPIPDNFNDNYGYAEVDITNETADATPPVPCSRNGADFSNREPDVPREHAPPPPVAIYITPVNDDIRLRKSSLPRPASQHSYLEMMELEPLETGSHDMPTPGIRLKEPGRPASQRSYLDMENQTSFRSRARADGETASKEGEEDYENGETENKEDYVNAAVPGPEDAVDSEAYLEPVARMSAHLVPAQAGLAPPDQDHSDSDSYCDPQLGPEV